MTMSIIVTMTVIMSMLCRRCSTQSLVFCSTLISFSRHLNSTHTKSQLSTQDSRTIKCVEDLISRGILTYHTMSAECSTIVADRPDEDVLDLDDGRIVFQLLLDARDMDTARSSLHQDLEYLNEEGFGCPESDEAEEEGACGVGDVVVAVGITFDTTSTPDNAGGDDDTDRLEAVAE